MRNVSSAWRRALFNDQRDYLRRVKITLKSGTVLNLTNENIWQSGFTVEDAVSSDNEFQLGGAIINKFSLAINNIYEDFSAYDFTNARVYVRVGLVTDEGTEYVEMGLYTVNSATYNGSIINLECLDDMAKFDQPYNEGTNKSTLTYPQTLEQIVLEACQKCGVTLGTLNFPHKSHEVATKPTDKNVTFREVLAWCAQIAGCYARMYVESEVAKLEISWYDQTALSNALDNLDGGIFDSHTPYYSTGDTANGGTFNPWNTGYVYDARDLNEDNGVHYINSLYTKDISVDDVVITGVKILVKTDDNDDPVHTELEGTSGYVVSIEENPLISTTTVDTIIAWLGQQLIGLRFRKASITHGSDPSIEAGDVALVFDGKGNSYPIVISRTVFNAGSAQQSVSAAQTPARNSAERFSAATRNYVAMRKVAKQERNVIEESIRQQLTANGGLHYTEEPEDPTDPQNTRKIYYLHNQTLLSESNIRIRFSQGGIAVTSNGTNPNPTWYGLTVSGEMLTNLLRSTGISFDWATGGTLTLGGYGNGKGQLLVNDASGNEVGRWNNSGISLTKGSINLGNGKFVVTNAGALTATSGTIGGLHIHDDYLYSGDYIDLVNDSPHSNDSMVYVGKGGICVYDYNGSASDTDIEITKHYLRFEMSGTDYGAIGVEPGDSSGFYLAGKVSYLNNALYNAQVRINRNSDVEVDIRPGLDVHGGLTVTGTKSRSVETEPYSKRLLYCYETSSPMFGDVGEGVIGSDGNCYVTIDPIFAETVNLSQYQVFLQKYGQGECYVSERKPSFFVVSGTEGLSFGWEIKAKQNDFDQLRLEMDLDTVSTENYRSYSTDAINHIQEIQHEREIT